MHLVLSTLILCAPVCHVGHQVAPLVLLRIYAQQVRDQYVLFHRLNSVELMIIINKEWQLWGLKLGIKEH